MAVGAICLFLAAGGLSLSCSRLLSTGGQPARQATPEALQVKVHTVQRKAADLPSRYSGDVKAKEMVNLVAKVSGRLEELKVEVGTPVTAGDLVAVIEHAALDAQLRQAQGALAVAEAQLAKLESSPRPEAVAAAEAVYEAARRGVEVAKNALWALQNDRDAICSLPDSAVRPSGYHPASPAYNCESYTARCFQAEAAVRVAEAQEKAAKQQLELARSPVTENDLAAARGQVTQAQSVAELARLQRVEAFVRAPISGVVSRRFLSPGAMVGPTVPMLTIISRDVKIDLAAEEASLSQFSSGRPVSLSVAAYPGVIFTGTVTSVAPAAEERTRSFAVEILPQDEEHRLRHGMFATVELETKGRGLPIPKEAVISKDGKDAVFVLEASKARIRWLTLGSVGEAQVEVLTGLTHGERVIVAPPPELEDGDAVRVSGAF